MRNKYQDTARMYKAFCDENRLRILDLLKGGEHCACELLDGLQISQSTLSHHMKILVDAGIVSGRKDGKWMHYVIDQEGVMKAQEFMAEFLYDQADTHINQCSTDK